MKKFSVLLLAFAMVLNIANINAQDGDKKELKTGPQMNFDATTIDYGTIEQNSDPLRVFTFKNDGTEPLVISNAKGSCGCTVPKYPKEPILPGQEAEIEVRYDTKRIGNFSKTVTLTTNATNGDSVDNPGTFVLKIKGKVNAVEPVVAPVITPQEDK
ncbi:MAG: DUF1573 domain-containing protein [Chitinophagales bacterium]